MSRMSCSASSSCARSSSSPPDTRGLLDASALLMNCFISSNSGSSCISWACAARMSPAVPPPPRLLIPASLAQTAGAPPTPRSRTLANQEASLSERWLLRRYPQNHVEYAFGRSIFGHFPSEAAAPASSRGGSCEPSLAVLVLGRRCERATRSSHRRHGAAVDAGCWGIDWPGCRCCCC